METDDEKTQMRYAEALAEYADAGGYDLEVTWDVCTVARPRRALRPGQVPRRCAPCRGGEQKRLVLEYLLRGPDEVLLLDEPDNFLDVPGKIWLEQRIRESDKTILLHQPRPRAAGQHRHPGRHRRARARAGNTVWTHPGGFASYHEARRDRFARFEELRRRWDEEHAKLKALVLMYKQKAAYNDGMASPLPGRPDPAAQVRGGRAADRAAPRAAGEDAAEGRPHRQARGGLRAASSSTGPDAAVRPRGLVRRAGRGARAPTAPASRTSCGCSRPAAATPTSSTSPVGEVADRRRSTTPARPSSAPGCGPGWFVQTHEHPELVGRTLLEILHRGDDARRRDGMGREQAARVLDRYELAHAAEQKFESLSGGQQARFQILLLELSGATLLLLDEPTDNLDVQSAEALEDGPGGVRGHGRSRSPTTAGSPAASTGSWSTARTATSTSPTGRSGTRAGSSAPADAAGLRRRTRPDDRSRADSVGTALLGWRPVGTVTDPDVSRTLESRAQELGGLRVGVEGEL